MVTNAEVRGIKKAASLLERKAAIVQEYADARKISYAAAEAELEAASRRHVRGDEQRTAPPPPARQSESDRRIAALEYEKASLVQRYAMSRGITSQGAEIELQQATRPPQVIDKAEMEAILSVARKRGIPYEQALKYSRAGAIDKLRQAPQRDEAGRLTATGLAEVQQRMREARERGEEPKFEDYVF